MGKNTFKITEQEPMEETTTKPSWWQRYKAFREKHTFAQYLQRLFLEALLYFLGISVGLVIIFKFVPGWFTPTMLDRKLEALADGRDTEDIS